MDVTASIGTLAEAGTNAALVGAAFLAVIGVIAGYRVIRRAF